MKGWSTEFFGIDIHLFISIHILFEFFYSVLIEFSFSSSKTSEYILFLLLLGQHRGWCIEVFAGNLASDL